MPKNWVIKKQAEPDEALIKASGSKLLAQLLLQRGIDSENKIKSFLNPLDFEPISPYSFKDMEKAIARIKKAIDEKQHIVICGDFDADGVTSTAVIHKTLKLLGANFSHFIPDRQIDNHGLSKSIIIKRIAKNQAKLFITVDCAISDIEEVNLINSLGADIIITDHHEAKDELPSAYAIINPKAQGSLQEDLSLDKIESLTSMAGVGVAFKLACALLDEYGQINFIQELLPLVALGTVADIMPLLHENRLFVVLGMKLMQEGKNLGIRALLEDAGITDDIALTTDKVAFTLAPRINAAGRLDSAETAFNLLVSENPSESLLLCKSLNNFNKIRQELGDKIFFEALEYIEKNKIENDASIIAYNPNWHIGIIGIVASRLVEKFNKPAFVFTDGTDDNILRASVRSVEGVNIFNVLEVNSDIIKSYGGHSMAAGLSLDKNETSLEQLRTAVNETILEMTDGVVAKPTLEVDLELTLDEINSDIVRDIAKLEPCGEGNSYPIFAIKNLILESERTVGQSNNHLKFVCADKKNNVADCVLWNCSSLNVEIGKPVDIAFYLKINEFNGVKSLQYEIKDYNSKYINIDKTNSIKIIDHRKKIDIFEQVADYIKTSEKTFKVFVEDKSLINLLSEYEPIKDNMLTRLNLEKTHQLMFVDYPADEKLFKFIVAACEPKIIHFMNYRVQEPDIDALIAKVSGMLKYAAKNYNGIVYLPEISSTLSISDELTTLIVKLLNRTNVVKVNDFRDGKIYFEFLEAVSAEKIKAHEVYEKCRMELFKSKNYRESVINSANLSSMIR